MTAALSHSDFLASRRLRSLDGVRAVAVLLVVTWHVRDGALSALNGDFGVTVFFVLSGFLITTLSLREELRHGRFSYAAFMIRRTFRILPLLWLGVLVYAIAVFVFHLDDRADAYARAIPYYLAYLPEVPLFSHPASGVGEGPVPFSGVWSIGIEEKFYLLWPLVTFYVLGRWKGARIWVAGGATVALWVFDAIGPAEAVRYLHFYAPILLGCAVALATHSPVGYARAVHLTSAWVSVPALGALLALNGQRHGALLTPVQQLLVALLVCAVVVRPGSLGSRALSTRWLGHVGLLSYAIYLFHGLSFKVVDKVLPAQDSAVVIACSLVAGLALVMLASQVLHVVYEKPLQELGRRWAARIARHDEPALGQLPAAQSSLLPVGREVLQ